MRDSRRTGSQGLSKTPKRAFLPLPVLRERAGVRVRWSANRTALTLPSPGVPGEGTGSVSPRPRNVVQTARLH